MSKWTKLWLLWLAVTIGGFFAIEMPGVFNDETGDTLTEHVVTNVPMELGVAIFGMLVALLIWLWVHFKVRYTSKRNK